MTDASSLLPLIHHFLQSKGYAEVAKALKKETSLKDTDTDVTLMDMFEWHQKNVGTKRKKADSDDGSSSDDDSSEEEEEKPAAKKAKKEESSDDDSSDDDDSSEEEETKKDAVEDEDATPKRKLEWETPQSKSAKGAKHERRQNTPFQRVDPNEAQLVSDPRLLDNSFKAQIGESNWGNKANDILLQVKGKGFRHEKTKKKRGSYTGGVIDQDSRSIKFNLSDDSD